MARLEERTREGRLSAIGIDDALLHDAARLAVDACSRGELLGTRVVLGGHETYFKKGPLRGGSRLRHALWRSLASVPLPRMREHFNLSWLRAHGFEAPRPLAAGSIVRGGLPRFQFLFTELVPDAETLESFLSKAVGPDRTRVLGELATSVGRMHAMGFIHHDLFPRNILVRASEREPRIVFLDAWAGGPTHVLRGPTYDLACFFLHAPVMLTREEPQAFFETYLRERERQGGAPDRTRFRRAVERERARLARKLSRKSAELRGRAPPSSKWSVSP